MESYELLHPRDHLSGQFVAKAVDEVSGGMSALSSPAPPALVPTAGLAARRDLLAAHGYVPATVLPMADLGGVEAWWDTHTLAAEYDPARPVVQMPATSDLAPDRRVARHTYEGPGTSLTMPNVAAVRRFSQANGNDVFDVPVSGTVEGREVTGWARVQQVRPGVWSAKVVGAPDSPLGEAVSAVLESRRVTHGLREAGDLISRRRERRAAAGAELEPVGSTWVTAVGYDHASGTMVTRISDRNYGHLVSAEVFEKVRGASSPGAAFNALVKGSPRSTVEQCPGCGRIYATVSTHVCRASNASSDAGTNAGRQTRMRARALAVANSVLRRRG